MYDRVTWRCIAPLQPWSRLRCFGPGQVPLLASDRASEFPLQSFRKFLLSLFINSGNFDWNDRNTSLNSEHARGYPLPSSRLSRRVTAPLGVLNRSLEHAAYVHPDCGRWQRGGAPDGRPAEGMCCFDAWMAPTSHALRVWGGGLCANPIGLAVIAHTVAVPESGPPQVRPLQLADVVGAVTVAICDGQRSAGHILLP